MKKKRIWIDIDNSPHVLFFSPIIKRLREDGHEVTVTARECAQTYGLLELHQISFTAIGRHYGKSLLRKVAGLAIRSIQLLHFALRKNIDLAVSHGSRSLVWTAYLLRIPCITLYDYEYVQTSLFNRLSTKVLLPELIPDEVLRSIGLDSDKVARYPGLKEEVYLDDFRPDPGIYRQLGIDRNRVLITIRPPATMAHYHNPESEKLFQAALRSIRSHEAVTAVVLPRNDEQREEVRRHDPVQGSLVIPEKPVDGLNLLWHSDIVISGGGTMNREAALLGVPVYSIFSGRRGAVDQALVRQGKLRFIRAAEDIEQIVFRKKEADPAPPRKNHRVIDVILDEILTTG